MLKSLGLWKTVDDVAKKMPDMSSDTTYMSEDSKSDTQVVVKEGVIGNSVVVVTQSSVDDNCEYFPGIIPLTYVYFNKCFKVKFICFKR